MSTALGIAKVNFKQAMPAYVITGTACLAMVVSYIIGMVLDDTTETVALGNFLYLLPITLAIFIPARNFSKLLNLGAKRTDFFWGCALTYLPVIIAVTVLSVIMHYTLDAFLVSRGVGILDVLVVFGFLAHGPVLACLQLICLLTLLVAFVHTLVIMQDRWYGWVADVVVVAIISVFTPIAPLRAALVWFFNLIIFHNVALVQIAACLVLAGLIYALSVLPTLSKQI